MNKRLYRDINNRMLAGVCAGVAAYFGLDPALVRVGAVILGLFLAPLMAVLYVLAAVIIPVEAGQTISGTTGAGYNNRGLGWLLIIVGGFLLFMNVLWPYMRLWFPQINFQALWPLVFVIVGLALILNSRRQ
ncbi:MAG: PspC domain-containing protein [Firmicutes bacterium]|nr:PspC domain-containing protein [Bacillota bacterium]